MIVLATIYMIGERSPDEEEEEEENHRACARESSPYDNKVFTIKLQ